jgi:hypothetical protein
MVMQPNWNNMTNGTTVQGSYSCPDGGVFGIVCPSVCLSHWDKRMTPVTNRCTATTCDGRVVNQRRGQDSVKACLLLFTVCSNAIQYHDFRRFSSLNLITAFYAPFLSLQ